MTIHDQHPFETPEGERDPVRRMRARLGGSVSLWTAGVAPDWAGLTVSSYLLSPGEPAHVVALLDEESELYERVLETGVAVVQLLEWPQRQLADAFAGQFPAPGGAFRLGDESGGWADTDWGPRLASATSWLGARLLPDQTRDVGWARLVDCAIEHIEVGAESEPLEHRRGRYRRG